MTTFAVLFQKEIRQNAVIYGVPALLLIAAVILQKQVNQIISLEWLKNMAITIPFALAFSYGLQSFDLEENGQTRDFLLTKPLSVRQIMAAKFFTGLSVLIPLTFCWHMVLVPQKMLWPNMDNFFSFWFLAYLFGTVITYTACFITGILVKGPKKILVGILAICVSVTLFYQMWFEFITMVYFEQTALSHFIAIFLLIIPFTLAVLIYFIKTAHQTAGNYLMNLPLKYLLFDLRWFLVVIVAVPLGLWSYNQFKKPVITPFKSLMSVIFFDEPWFKVSTGEKQSMGELFAVVSTGGQLALVKPGEKPVTLYDGEKEAGNLLINPTWSSQGTHLAFSENGQIKVLPVKENKPVSLIPGDQAFWSHDDRYLLVAQKTNETKQSHQGLPITLRSYKLTHIDLLKNIAYPQNGLLTFPGHSLAWVMPENQIIAVDDLWTLSLMDLSNGRINSFKVVPQKKPNGPVIFTQIVPENRDKSWIIAYFSINRLRLEEKQYDLHLFRFHLPNKTITVLNSFEGMSYRQMIIDPLKHELLASHGNGVFHSIPFEKGAVKK